MSQEILWSQFGAAIDMLENAMVACPDTLWCDGSRDPQFWYVAYHALFWLDLYLSGAIEQFAPPAPFTLSELDSLGILPERVYEKEELAAYLAHCRAKCRATIDTLTDESARRRCTFPWGAVSFAELLLYNMRHVQGHAAELSLILGQTVGSGPRWVTKTKHAG